MGPKIASKDGTKKPAEDSSSSFESEEEDALVPNKIRTRTQPSKFLKKLKNLNQPQKTSVCELGFESILSLTNKSVPKCLGWCVVENFDPHKTCLRMADGETILIEDSDVHIALGIPLGSIEIPTDNTDDNCNALVEWRSKIKPNKRIYPSDVYAHMLAEVEGGDFFKRCFMVLVISMIFESTTNGTVNVSYFQQLEDVSKIKDLNWCGFVLDRLVRAKIQWDPNKKSFFRGSPLFLSLLYADRTEYIRKRNNERTIPAFLTWTEDKLMKRETEEMGGAGFGHGRVLPRQEIPSATPVPPQRKQGLKERYIQEMNILSKSMASLVQLTIEGLVECKDDPDFQNMAEATRRLIGEGSNHTGIQAEAHIPDDVAWCESQHSYWNDPQFIACLEKVENALAKKAELKAIDNDAPTFKLGLTQDFNSWSPVQDVANQCMGEVGPSKTPPIHVAEGPTDVGDNELVTTNLRQPKSVNVVGDTVKENGHPKLKLRIPVNRGNVSQKVVVQDPPTALCLVSEKRSKRKHDKLDEPKVSANVSGEIDDGTKVASRSKPEGNFADDKRSKQKTVLDIVDKRKQPKRNKNPTEDNRSPYFNRFINPGLRRTIELTRTFSFTLDGGDAKAPLFKCKGFSLQRQHLRTMQHEFEVETPVVDAWARILIEKEKFRSPSSPYRFFGTCDASSGSVGPTAIGGRAGRYQHFEERMNELLKVDNPSTRLKDIDMIIFPVFHVDHYYITAFNFKSKLVQVIDHGDPTISFQDMYGDIPKNLRDMLVRYLCGKQLGWKAALIRNTNPLRVDIQWTNTANKIDSGIYCMRHMETYMGVIGPDWKTGFIKDQDKNIINFREFYTQAIIKSDINELKDKIIPQI